MGSAGRPEEEWIAFAIEPEKRAGIQYQKRIRQDFAHQTSHLPSLDPAIVYACVAVTTNVTMDSSDEKLTKVLILVNHGTLRGKRKIIPSNPA